MKINLPNSTEDAQIQIVPLIDVIFCILTFFLLAALQFTRQQAINIDLPKASTGTSSNVSAQGQSNILPVTIDAVGQTYVEKQPVQREQLAEILKNYVKSNPNGILVLNASRTATYNDVIQTLDLLRQVGGDRVSLGIIPGSAQPSVNPGIPTIPAPVIPNTVPVPGANPTDNLNPAVPNPGVAPVNPNVPVPQAPVAPGTNNTAPNR